MLLQKQIPYVLMNTADDGTGGGGNGGGSGGGNAGGNGGGAGDGGAGGGDVPKAFQDYVGKAVNAALTNFTKRGSFEAAIKNAVQGTVKDTLAEALKDFKPQGGGDNGGGGGDDKDKAKAGANDEVTVELKKTRAELDRMAKEIKVKDEQAAAERAARAKAEEKSALTASLLKHGIPETRARAAAALLYNEEGRIKRNDAGDICMVVKATYGNETIEETVPIDKAIENWVRSPEGKEFVPAVAAGGSGERGGKPPTRKPGEKPTAREAFAFLAQSMIKGDGFNRSE